MRVAVVGGGITGLAAAWEVVCSAPDAEVTIFEPARLGGRIRTSPFLGRDVDEGPDAFLTRVPDAVALCGELGIGAELVAPAVGSSMLWWGDRLRPLPDGLVLGVPRRLGAIAAGGVLSPSGALRAALDLVLPRRGPGATGSDGGDVSVFDLVASRFGRQVAARLVDPLVGGIHAGRTEQLSAEATVPQLLAASRASRSMLRALGRAAPSTAAGPIFLSPAGGMSVLVDAATGRLETAGARIERRRVRTVVAPPSGPGAIVDGEHFDAAVLAVATTEAAGMLEGGAPAAAEGLRGIGYASVVLTTLAWAAEDVAVPAGVNGFLVPREGGHLMTACSFASSKWPHWADEGTVVVRVSAGRHLDTRAMDLDDDSLTGRLVDELGSALGVALRAPAAVRTTRWPASFPQYGVGHLGRVRAIEAAVATDLPCVTLAGAGYRGSGIPACIASGRAAARAALGARCRP